MEGPLVWMQGPLVQMEVGEGNWKREASGAGAAWVEVENVVSGLDHGLVAMAVDHGADAGGRGVEVQVGDVVDEIEETAGEFDGFGCGKLRARARAVDVAADGGEWSDGGEAVEDGGVADVAGVEDVVNAHEGDEGFGAEEAVGVGDYAYAHGLEVTGGVCR